LLIACNRKQYRFNKRMTCPDTAALLLILRLADFTAARLDGPLGAIHGLSLADVRLMRLVAGAPGGRISRGALALQLHLSASTITRMAAPLEKIGVLARQPDARDARIGYLALTPAGQEILTNANATLDQHCQSLVAGRWSAEDHAALAGLLGKITAGLPG
jgi:DNA-binding MarR family transcriptional regulator